MAGILNAPWKTNEDRQNLLPGIYNDELLDAAATMVASTLPKLETLEDPAKHLDALPRREEAGDSEHSNRLRDRLYSILANQAIVPDQIGSLRKMTEVSFPPIELIGTPQAAVALTRWSDAECRPVDWIHNSALTRTRFARLDRITASSSPFENALHHASIAEWLEALTRIPELEIQGSRAAIQTAARLPKGIRDHDLLGKILLTAEGNWVDLDPDKIFLATEFSSESDDTVHPELQYDPDTLSALMDLGVKPASPESIFKNAASHLLDGRRFFHIFTEPFIRSDPQKASDREWCDFWNIARILEPDVASRIIQDQTIGSGLKQWECWRESLYVRTVDGSWKPFFCVLLPGDIVPRDGSRDGNVAIDTRFHGPDLTLLRTLGAVAEPRERQELPLAMWSFVSDRRVEFTKRDLPSSPVKEMLNFRATTTSGPLAVLLALSGKGKALYTWKLLVLAGTYEKWIMRHDTRDIYGSVEFDSPAVHYLRDYGCIEVDGEFHKLADGLGDPPKNSAVLRKLLSHPQVASIRGAFGIRTDYVEPFGEDEPVPLTDIWPGLVPYLTERQADLDLVRCDGLVTLGSDQGEDEQDCVIKENFVYVTRKDSEAELQTLLRELGLQLSQDKVKLILLGLTDEDVQAAREAVRGHETDAERLLEAVGESELRRRLPLVLIEILEADNDGPLSGVQVAQAAIATFHTGALREYRHALLHLAPPRKWAGSPTAVAFVQSLGFGEEWAMERNARRDPYIEVDGPYSLPPLHGYQHKIVDKVRRLVRSDGALGERRGMISLPTGSGKTRVAVQAMVEALREEEFADGILWVADRDELCEQAVEAWRQVWSSEGKQSVQLRISRMWAGQPSPLPTSDMHVIVASIQTLFSKMSRQLDNYEFLADFKLVVFDEAHRSVAPTFTAVMEDLGMTRRRRASEPFLIGLTATPYRGYNEDETRWLVNRYSDNRLDRGAFKSDEPEAVIGELQDMRVLARADQATVEGGSFSLSEDELRQARDLPWLPESVEQRIAEDADRTRRIMQAYLDRIEPHWPTLIFATSVDHAQVLSALLDSNGISSRAVSGKTDRIVRRRVVEEFRNGKIQALVNYGVFREGFDAPRTRAIIVARPVYSPNLYFQMIGRGLRGELNGGNDRCLILNVEDNIENFEGKLAFSELDWLWD